jgi:hypothetical protein
MVHVHLLLVHAGRGEHAVLHHHGHFLLVGGVHRGCADVELVQKLARVLDDEANRLPGFDRDGLRLIEVVAHHDRNGARLGASLGGFADRGGFVRMTGLARGGESQARGDEDAGAGHQGSDGAEGAGVQTHVGCPLSLASPRRAEARKLRLPAKEGRNGKGWIEEGQRPNSLGLKATEKQAGEPVRRGREWRAQLGHRGINRSRLETSNLIGALVAARPANGEQRHEASSPRSLASQRLQAAALGGRRRGETERSRSLSSVTICTRVGFCARGIT